MASGDLLFAFSIQAVELPASNAAQLDERNGHPILAFDPTTNESVVWSGWLPPFYTGGGINVNVVWTGASGVTTGDVIWQSAFERDDSGTDLDSDSFATAQSVTTTAPGTSGAPVISTIAHTNAQIDGLLANEFFRIKITRNASSASDTMTGGDAQVFYVTGREV